MTLRVMITAVLVITVASLARATTNDDDANATCSDGTPGYQTRSACCVIECGFCGYAGCGIRNGLGADYCCADQIEWDGEHCSVKGEAPCHLVTPSPIVSPYTPSPTSPPTGTPSPTSPPTGTPSPTSPPTGTPSPTSPPTGTPSPTSPPTGTPSPTSPPTGTPSPTSPPTGTPSPTSPPTGTPSPTSPPTGTPSPTSPPTGTPSPTSPPTGTPSPTSPPTGTPSPTSPPTGTPSPTSPPTGTPSPTSSPTGTPSPTSSPIVDWCDKLKSAIEANKRVTYKLNINLICDETIIITKGKHATLTSSAGAPNGKYSISPSSQFIGRRSSASRIASLADIGGDESLFVVENGGSLSVKNVIFDLSLSDKEGGGKTASSPYTETPVNGSPSTSTTDTAINGSPSTSTTTVAINGPLSTSHTATATNGSSMSSLSEVGHKRVRAIYTAGKVNIENCSFVGSPYVATESVMNGGAIFMVDVDDTPSGPSSVICTGSTFDSYSVGGSGGAIFAEGSGLLQVTGSSFSKNSAGGSGAGENADKTNDSGADTVGNGKGGNDPKTVSNIFINSTGIRKGGNGSYITTDSTTDEASTDDGGRGTDTAINTFIATTGEVKGGNGTGNTTEHFTNTTGSGGIDLNITTDIFTDTTGIGEDGTGTKTTPDIVNVIMSAGGGGGGGGFASYSDNTTDKATYTVDTGDGREETSGGAGLRDPDTDITTSRTSNIVDSRASASTVAGAGGGGSGGAIYAGPDVALNVRDSTFEENTATDGGAIASYGGALTNIIISNTVTTEIGFGAVVSNDPDGKTSPRGLSISDSTFKGNTGGATATFNTNVDIKNSIFIYNDGAVYFGTLDLERGFKLRVDGGRFEGNGPTPPSWGAGIFTGSGDLIGNNSGNGQAISCVKLLGVNCTDESECSMAVDEAAFAVTRDDTDCKICNENGQIVEIYNEYGQAVEMPSSSSDEIVGVSFASNDIDSASFIVAMCIVGIVACACCVSCIVSTVKEFQQEKTATTTNFTTFGSAWEAPHLGSDTQYVSERSYGVGNVADQETRLDI